MKKEKVWLYIFGANPLLPVNEIFILKPKK